MTTAEIAAKMRPYYPKATKTTVSIALRTHETGVMFCPAAKRIYAFYSGRKPRDSRRTKPCRFTLRLTESCSERVKRAMERNGVTFQTFAEQAILEFLEKENRLPEGRR